MIIVLCMQNLNYQHNSFKMTEENINEVTIIFNVTVKVERTIADRWLQWMQQEHIAQIMNTKCFIDYRIVRLLDIDDSEGPTYAIQYGAASKADYNRYMELYANKMNDVSYKKWGNGFIAFRSIMEVIK